jgi:hypothetical protein
MRGSWVQREPYRGEPVGEAEEGPVGETEEEPVGETEGNQLAKLR